MNNHNFPDAYVDDLVSIDPEDNYFVPVWDSVFRLGFAPQRLLDVGCGNGAFTQYAKKIADCRLYGVDGSDYALSLAQGRGYEQLARIRDFNRDPLPFETGAFDFCLCKDLLEHLADPVFVLREIQRVLQPQGYCLLHVPNHFPLYGRLRFLVSNDIDTFSYFPGARRWDFPHLRFFTHQSLVDLAGETGFRTVADMSFHFPSLPMLGWVPFGRSLGRRLAKFNPSQFAGGFTLLVTKAECTHP